VADGDTWLEPSIVKAMLGESLSAQLDDASLTAIVPGVRDWVEDKRKDLLVTNTDEPPVTTFAAPPRVVLGASMLVWRTYDRRRTPAGLLGSSEDGYAGVIRDDPDIARYLGIGSSGKFVFGASPRAETVEVV
jgi:hypothetical protein